MSKRFDLSGKVALVTGASSGLGVHFARTLAEAGASVAIAARRADRLASLQAELQQGGARALAVDLDVQSAASIAAAFDKVEAALGPVDILVNNAGITRDSTMRRLTRDMWDAVIDTNLGSCFNMSKAVWEGMNTRGFGRIVNLGADSVRNGLFDHAAYNAAYFKKYVRAPKTAMPGATMEAHPHYTDEQLAELIAFIVAEPRG
eukprot:gene6802-8675_t